LINDPDLVILDEPTSGLDPIGCREVKDLILALARRGKTVILSSHLLADVEDVCDRVVVYYGGKVQAMGPLKDLLAKPDSLRITTPVLPRGTLEKVLAVLRADVAEEQVRVETPTQNLESYFLGVVEAARASEAQTSGALSGSQVAAYLRGEAEESVRTDRVLDRLTRASAGPTPDVTVAKPVEEVNHGLLERLVTAPPASAEAGKIEREEPVKPADLREANEKLSSLLRKPKS
jgi:ABC-2 type transport system ATP-binding protein